MQPCLSNSMPEKSFLRRRGPTMASRLISERPTAQEVVICGPVSWNMETETRSCSGVATSLLGTVGCFDGPRRRGWFVYWWSYHAVYVHPSLARHLAPGGRFPTSGIVQCWPRAPCVDTSRSLWLLLLIPIYVLDRNRCADNGDRYKWGLRVLVSGNPWENAAVLHGLGKGQWDIHSYRGGTMF